MEQTLPTMDAPEVAQGEGPKAKRRGRKPGRRKRSPRPHIDYAELVAAFRDLETLDEIAARFGTTNAHVSGLASRLRRKGVAVRMLINGRNTIDVDHLNAVAAGKK